MATFTPKAAFGYVVYICDAPAGYERDVTLGTDGMTASGLYYYTKGRVSIVVAETGEVLIDRAAGWLNSEHPEGRATVGNAVRTAYLEDSQWVCIPYNKNNGKVPELASLTLPVGQSHVLPNGTNLYLVKGQLDVNGRLFEGPVQIRVRSGDVTATSIGDTSYSLNFL